MKSSVFKCDQFGLMKAVNGMVEGHKKAKGKKDMASGFSFGDAAQKLSFGQASSPPDTSASSTDGTASPNVFSTAESKPNRLRKAEVVQRAKFTLPQDVSQNGERQLKI